jgi:hypothetical protein
MDACDVDGREGSRPSWGRGGRGGGVPSLDGSERQLAEDFREREWIIFRVGLVKACCWPCSTLVPVLLLCRAGVADALEPSAAGTRGSAASVPSMGAVAVNGHGARDGGVAATRCRLCEKRIWA